jgi:hypothetical protein
LYPANRKPYLAVFSHTPINFAFFCARAIATELDFGMRGSAVIGFHITFLDEIGDIPDVTLTGRFKYTIIGLFG